MKKLLIGIMCIVGCVCNSYAQNILVGDMNDDGDINISDVTALVNTILGKAEKRTISAGTDYTSLLGSWCTKDNLFMSFADNGKAGMKKQGVDMGAKTYEFYPANNLLAFYDSSKRLVASYQVKSITPEKITVVLPDSYIFTPIELYANSTMATGISLSAKSHQLFLGQTLQLTASPIPADAVMPNYTWSSSNTSYATVSSTGLVKAVAPGTVNITAKTSTGLQATCQVHCLRPVSSITVSPSPLTLAKGSSYSLTANVAPSDASIKEVDWFSSDSTVAKVNSNGTVVALRNGTATIKAEAMDASGVYGQTKVTVVDAPTAIKINNVNTFNIVNTDARKKMSYTITPSTSDGVKLIWSTSDESVATIDENGILQTKGKEGKINVIAMVAGTSVSSTLTVNVAFTPSVVDLGLPSGVKWAKTNLGSMTSYDKGNYYAYGETTGVGEVPSAYPSSKTLDWTGDKNSNYTALVTNKTPKTNYDQKYYKWHNLSTITKYLMPDKMLEQADDAASQNWATTWSTPTADDFDELIANCYWEWTTDYKGLGRTGYIVYKRKSTLDTSTTHGSTYNYSEQSDTHIFLPAAGNFFTTSVANPNIGYYMAANTSSIYYARIYQMEQGVLKRSAFYKENGYTIRPVYKE